jgi:hypothetical protein
MSVVRLFIFAMITACAGCVPWRFTETAHVRGEVYDQMTKKPVAGAKLHEKRFSGQIVATSSDGHFDFPAIHQWSVFYLVPAPDVNHDFFPLRSLVIEAPGYHNNEMNIPKSGTLFSQVIYLTPNP